MGTRILRTAVLLRRAVRAAPGADVSVTPAEATSAVLWRILSCVLGLLSRARRACCCRRCVDAEDEEAEMNRYQEVCTSMVDSLQTFFQPLATVYDHGCPGDVVTGGRRQIDGHVGDIFSRAKTL